MLQSLLANRFKLVLHRENRETAIYALVVAMAKGGPKPKEPVGEPEPAGHRWAISRWKRDWYIPREAIRYGSHQGVTGCCVWNPPG